MAEFPALPLFTDAYLADTRHLSTEQHGAYLLLLMEAWRRPNTNLPDDDVLLAKLAGLSGIAFADAKSVIMSFWELDGRTKTWSQKRLTDEKSYVKKNSKKQRSNAKARWDKEKPVSHGNANSHASELPNASQNDAPTPTPTPTPTEEKKNNLTVIPKKGSKPKLVRGTRLASDWLPRDEDIANFINRGMTDTVFERELEKFKDYWAAKPGQDGIKMDWDATWRNWMRRVQENGRLAS